MCTYTHTHTNLNSLSENFIMKVLKLTIMLSLNPSYMFIYPTHIWEKYNIWFRTNYGII